MAASNANFHSFQTRCYLSYRHLPTLSVFKSLLPALQQLTSGRRRRWGERSTLVGWWERERHENPAAHQSDDYHVAQRQYCVQANLQFSEPFQKSPLSADHVLMCGAVPGAEHGLRGVIINCLFRAIVLFNCSFKINDLGMQSWEH